MTWEKFLDESYFDMWAVRPTGSNNFNNGMLFHLPFKNEAKRLCDALNATVEEIKKHDCEKWRDEGMGCSLCHHSTRPIEEVKELQSWSNWKQSELEQTVKAQQETIDEQDRKINRIIIENERELSNLKEQLEQAIFERDDNAKDCGVYLHEIAELKKVASEK